MEGRPLDPAPDYSALHEAVALYPNIHWGVLKIDNGGWYGGLDGYLHALPLYRSPDYPTQQAAIDDLTDRLRRWGRTSEEKNDVR